MAAIPKVQFIEGENKNIWSLMKESEKEWNKQDKWEGKGKKKKKKKMEWLENEIIKMLHRANKKIAVKIKSWQKLKGHSLCKLRGNAKE